MAGRYLATELQDDNGDVIYPHTEADIVFTSDGTTVEENLGGDVTDSEIQEIFSDSDSQLESGKKLSVKEKIKKTLKRYQTLLRMRILDTVEEVEANTDDGYLMGAKAGAALINDLAQQPEFLYDSSGKITGYKSPGGADTVFPFNKAMRSVDVTKPSASTATMEVELPNVDPNATIDQIFPVITGATVYNYSVNGNHVASNVPSVSNFTGSKITVNGLFSSNSSGLNFYFNVKIVYPSK